MSVWEGLAGSFQLMRPTLVERNEERSGHSRSLPDAEQVGRGTMRCDFLPLANATSLCSKIFTPNVQNSDRFDPIHCISLSKAPHCAPKQIFQTAFGWIASPSASQCHNILMHFAFSEA